MTLNIVEVRDLLKDVVDAGRMTKDAKENLHKAFTLLDNKVRDNEARDVFRGEGLEIAEYGVTTLLKDMQSAVNVFSKYPKAHNAALEDVKYLDEVRQDIWHSAEFLEFSDEEKIEKWNILEESAKKRRRAKELAEATKPIKMLLAKHNGIEKDLKNCMQQIRQIENLQESRCYTPKRLTELESAFHKAAPVKENGQVVHKEEVAQ